MAGSHHEEDGGGAPNTSTPGTMSYAAAVKEELPDAAPVQGDDSQSNLKQEANETNDNTDNLVKEEKPAADPTPAEAHTGNTPAASGKDAQEHQRKTSTGSISYADAAKMEPPKEESHEEAHEEPYEEEPPQTEVHKEQPEVDKPSVLKLKRKSERGSRASTQKDNSEDSKLTKDGAPSKPASRTPAKDVSYADAVKENSNGHHEEAVSTNGSSLRRRAGANGDAVKDWITGTEKSSVPGSRKDKKKPTQLQHHHHEQHRHFAPLNIPVRRRLQTLAIFIHCSCLMFAIPFFLFICSNPLTWPFMIPYLLHVIYSNAAVDGRLKYRSKYFRSLPIWTWFAEYFPAQLHKTHDLPATRKYIFGYHPHGIISHGAFVAFATEALGFSKKFPGITNCLLTLDSNFKIPLYREYVLAAGMGSVSKQSIKNILGNGGANGEGMGRGVTIVIGGARESLEAQPGTMKLILKERLGFVKMAIQTGADLVPVVGFGETDLYDQLNKEEHPWVHRFQLFVLRAMKFTLPFMRGRGVFNYDYGLMPYRRPLNIVVGKPIKVEAAAGAGVDGLNAEVVRKVHAQYVEELERLWETYKDVYMPERSGELQLLV